MLVGCRSLPGLQRLCICGSEQNGEGMASLMTGLHRGGLPSLQSLSIIDAKIGPHGAAALAAALKRALASLEVLLLDSNPLGDAGLAALAPALHNLPLLKILSLSETSVTDQGVASLISLVAEPTARVLMSLEVLRLKDNQIGSAGCASLACALRGGALPALKELELEGNRAGVLFEVEIDEALSRDDEIRWSRR